MKVRICYFLNPDYMDSFILTGNTPEEIREKAMPELEKRKAVDYWSELLEE